MLQFQLLMLKHHLIKTAKTPEINFLFPFSSMSNYVEYILNVPKKGKKHKNSNRLIKIQRRYKEKSLDHKLIFHGGLFRNSEKIISVFRSRSNSSSRRFSSPESSTILFPFSSENAFETPDRNKYRTSRFKLCLAAVKLTT